MSPNRRHRPTMPAAGTGGAAGSPIAPAAPSRKGASAAGNRAARRPGHAGRLRAEAQRVAAADRERVVTARHRRNVGFRVAILAAIIMVVFVVIFSPLRMYLSQRQELAALRVELTKAQAATDDLDAELDRWRDPAYVQALAREKLGFVMPGDISFKVVDAENAPIVVPTDAPTPAVTHVVAPDDDADQDPWYTRLEESIYLAGAIPSPSVLPDGGP